MESFREESIQEGNHIRTTVLYAVSQPDDVDISDLIVRPSLEA